VWGDAAFYHEKAHNDDEANFWAAGVGGAWTPAPGLSMGPEFAWNRWDPDEDPAFRPRTLDGYDVYSVMWRVQRNF